MATLVLVLAAVAAAALVAGGGTAVATKRAVRIPVPGRACPEPVRLPSPVPVRRLVPRAYGDGRRSDYRSVLVGYQYARAPAGAYPFAHRAPFAASSRYACSPVSTLSQGLEGGPIDEYGRLYGGRAPSIKETLSRGLELADLPGFGALRDVVDALSDILSHVASSPLWDIAVTGAYLLPGGGPLVSAGLRAAVELGRGRSLTDAALAAARDALPPGPARAGFDVATGAADLDEAAVGLLRDRVRDELGEPGVRAFDAGRRQLSR